MKTAITDQWELEYLTKDTSNTRPFHPFWENEVIWKELYNPVEKNRIEYIELGEFEEDHVYRRHYVNSRFIVYIGVEMDVDFSAFGDWQKYKSNLTKIAKKVKTYTSASIGGTFFGFDTIIEMLEFVEKIKEMAKRQEI